MRLIVKETYAASYPVAAAPGGAPMLRRRSARWLVPLTVGGLLLAACSDGADTDDAEAEVPSTVEGFGAVVNDYDTETIRGYVTDDFT